MKVNQLRVGTLLSYVNLAIGSIIPMIYTPIMLRILGQAEYGLYSLSNSIVGYLSLLNFGFGSTIIRYICKYRAEGKKEQVRSIFGLFLIIYGIVSVLVIIGGFILMLCTDSCFSKGLTQQEVDKLKILIVMMAFNTAIAFPISVFSSIITAYERFIFRRVIDIFSTVLAPVANIILLYCGFGSIGMTFSGLLLNFIACPVNIYYCFKVLKIIPKFVRFESVFIKELLVFSVYMFIGTLVDMLFWATDKVILGALVGTAVVAIYNVGSTFNNILMQLSQAVSGVIGPKINSMVTLDGENTQALSEVFIRVGRLQYLLLALVVSGFIALGHPFLIMWAGENYGESYYIALVTMIPLIIPYIQNTGLTIVIAQNKHKFRSLVYLAIAILNAVSTYFIVPYFGGIGAALCSCVSYILGQGIIMNIYYYKVTKINIPLFWKNILCMSWIPTLLCVMTFIVSNFVNFYSWSVFLFTVLIYVVLYSVGSWFFSMNDYEKDVIRVPINNLLNKLKKRKA